MVAFFKFLFLAVCFLWYINLCGLFNAKANLIEEQQ